MNRLQKLCNSFLWDNQESRRIHWTSWEKLCLPIQEGGLGFRSLYDMELAFATKIWWKLRQNDSPSHHRLRSCTKNILGTFIHLWLRIEEWRKRLLSIRSIAKENIRYCIGEGLVEFWHSRWLLDKPLLRYSLMSNSYHCYVAEFISHHDWNSQLPHLYLTNNVVSIILQTKIQPSAKDVLVWLPSSNGLFTISLAWELIRKRRIFSTVGQGLWSLLLPLKISYSGWRLILEFSQLDNKIQQRGIPLVSRLGVARRRRSLCLIFFCMVVLL